MIFANSDHKPARIEPTPRVSSATPHSDDLAASTKPPLSGCACSPRTTFKLKHRESDVTLRASCEMLLLQAATSQCHPVQTGKGICCWQPVIGNNGQCCENTDCCGAQHWADVFFCFANNATQLLSCQGYLTGLDCWEEDYYYRCTPRWPPPPEGGGQGFPSPFFPARPCPLGGCSSACSGTSSATVSH